MKSLSEKFTLVTVNDIVVKPPRRQDRPEDQGNDIFEANVNERR